MLAIIMLESFGLDPIDLITLGLTTLSITSKITNKCL